MYKATNKQTKQKQYVVLVQKMSVFGLHRVHA